jgi:hypothetical protein
MEGGASSSWNTWTRNVDRSNEDNLSPKKAKKGEGSSFQKGNSSQSQGEGDSSQEGRRRHMRHNEGLEGIIEEHGKEQENAEG